jgi:hypothetical protein
MIAMRDGHLVKRISREFAKALTWTLVLFGSLVTIFVSSGGRPAARYDGLRRHLVGRRRGDSRRAEALKRRVLCRKFALQQVSSFFAGMPKC